MNSFVLKSIRQARRLVVAVVGSSILLVGVAMIVLPGPSVLVIPAGLGILASEFIWARRLLRQVQCRVQAAAQRVGLGSGVAGGASCSREPETRGEDRSAGAGNA